MMLSFYRMFTGLGAPLIALYLSRRLKKGKEDPERFTERLGIASIPRPDGKLVWIHAASVGEALSMLKVIEQILQKYNGWSVLVTTGTVTSAKLMKDRLGERAFHQYVPVDRVKYVRRFLEHWQPNLGIWAESEFWPNMVIETKASAIPMIVLNGRMSARSFARWKKYPGMIWQILNSFSAVLAGSDVDAERFKELGAKNVSAPGNLKYAAGPLPVDEAELAKLKSEISGRQLWLAISTHPGEEAIVGKTHLELERSHKELLSIIAPRHPERGPEIANQLKNMGLKVSLRSRAQAIEPDTQIYIADTMGELGIFYRLAKISFVGKSLLGNGGQNPLEAAWLENAIILGPNMENFEDISSALIKSGGAIQIKNGDELAGTVSGLLDSPDETKKMAACSLNEARSMAGSIEKIMLALEPFFTKADERP
ncbi:MAG: 3-deoxy-D-manno-octulosonic acid transferase [Rhodospirillaceae bacterium]|nr:3-deoxy-D-manno-octulosonic acid transferase [Rhodospirillaceae bacterium]